jgi:serine/threonine protein kinase
MYLPASKALCVKVAVKMIKDTDTLSQSAVDDMEREVRLMKRLSHHNIVKIRGVSNNRTHTIIVMEFIREGSLDR